MQALNRVWRSSTYTLTHKIQIYESMVTSVLTYALETQNLNDLNIRSLESHRIQHIRRITRSPVFISRETNIDLRARVNLPSMQSLLQTKRLFFLQKLLKSAENNLAPLTALFGTSCSDNFQPRTPANSKRINNLATDLMELATILQSSNPCPQPIAKSNMIDPAVFTWLTNLDKSEIAQTLSPISTTERIHTKNFVGPKLEPKFQCETCSTAFSTKAQLMVHKYSAHGQQDQFRQLIKKLLAPSASRISKKSDMPNFTSKKSADQTLPRKHSLPWPT